MRKSKHGYEEWLEMKAGGERERCFIGGGRVTAVIRARAMLVEVVV